MTSLRIAAALVIALAWTPSARAHGASHQIERRGAAWAVRVTGHGGSPLAAAPFQVLRPGEDEPLREGTTGPDGWMEFVPDVPGTWRVKVVDRTGHGKTVAVEIGELAAPKPTATPTTTTTTTSASASAIPTPTASPPSTASPIPTPADGPRPAGVVLAAAGILVFFLVVRRAQRRSRAGR